MFCLFEILTDSKTYESAVDLVTTRNALRRISAIASFSTSFVPSLPSAAALISEASD